MTVKHRSDTRSSPDYDKRALMFPICSGTICSINIVLQLVAVSTSYWAHFKRERYPEVDLLQNALEPTTITKPDPLYEEGHYGLWSVCLTAFDGRRLEVEDCSTNIIHFHPSSWRIFAGIIAIIKIIITLIYMIAIPLQIRHLRSGRPVYCKYKTLTRIKMVLSIVGALCGVMAAVLFGIHSHHKHYKEPKGWSFGLQIIVIIVQVFLIICSCAENVMATRIDEARPKPQFLFTVSGSGVRKQSGGGDFGSPFHSAPTMVGVGDVSNALPTSNVSKVKKKKKKRQVEKLTEVVTVHDLSRANPIYVDSDNEDAQEAHNTPPVTNSRFVVFKVADMYSNADGTREAYDNLGYVANEIDQLDSLDSKGRATTKITNI